MMFTIGSTEKGNRWNLKQRERFPRERAEEKSYDS